MNKEKYTYKDWWEGIVYLETCPIKFTKGADVGIKVDLRKFSKIDAQKIRKKQKEIFEKQRDKNLKLFIDTFKKRFKNSDAKLDYLKREFVDVNNIISDESGLSPQFYNWNITIRREDLSEMRAYVKEQIIKGEKNYGFIHSPNYIFQSKNKIPNEIYARISWDYFVWLNNFVDSLNKKYSKSEFNEGIQKTNEKLGVPVIALLHFYRRTPISRENCKEIAATFGYNSKNSGEGLFQDYTKYSKNSNRIGVNDESKRKNETKRIFLAKAVTLLKGKAKKNAQADLAILEKKIQEIEN
jgi:hypothetical protein